MEGFAAAEQEEDWQEAMEDEQDDAEVFMDAMDNQDDGQYELHKAVWDGNVQQVKNLLAKPGAAQAAAKALDPHGNTVMHIAAHRGNMQVLAALLDAGLPAAPRTPTCWLPRHTALQAGHKQAVARLDAAQMEQLKMKMKQQRAALMTRLTGLPDFTMQLKWELVSSVPGISMLLRRVAPHDTYTLYKQGAKLRMDGTLMGASEGSTNGSDAGSSTGLLPQWERGHFSLIYDGSDASSPRVLFINHTEKTWIDLKALHKALKPEEQESLNQQLEASLMATAAAHGMLDDTVVKSRDFRFDAVQGWISKSLNEDVDGWQAKVYEASFALVKLKRFRLPCPLGASATWEQYLATDMPQDMVLEVPMHPISSMLGSKQDAHAKEAAHAMRHAAMREARRLTAHFHPAPPPPRHLISSTTSTDASSLWPQSFNGIPSTTSTMHQNSMKRQGSMGRQGSMQRQASDGLRLQTSRNGREEFGNPEVADSNWPAGGTTSPSHRAVQGPAVPVSGSFAGTLGPQSGEVHSSTMNSTPVATVSVQPTSSNIQLDAKIANSTGMHLGALPTQTSVHASHDVAGDSNSKALLSEQVGSAGQHAGSSLHYTRHSDDPPTVARSVHPAVAASGGAGHSFKPARRMTGRCWMAEGFPLSLHDLLPLLQAISTTNKYMAKVAQFMSKYGDRKEFPVKVQVPLMFTLSFIVACKKFKLLPTATAPDPTGASASGAAPKKKSFWRSFASDSTSNSARKPVQADALPAGFFDVPAGYVRIEEDQAKKRSSAGGGLF